MAAEAPRRFRHLSPSIAPKQHFLTVDVDLAFPLQGDRDISKAQLLIETKASY